jgi:predicted CXXCH cytochrome family protein
VKSLNNDRARRIRVRAVVACPALSVALVVSIALALTPFGPSRVMALTPTPAPTTSSSPATTSPSALVTPLPPVASSLSSSTASAPGASTSGTGATPSPTANPSPSSRTVEPGAVPVSHHVLARIEGFRLLANYLPVDASVPDATQFQTFRVRFQLHNAGTLPISLTPQLEFRSATTGYVVVPEKPRKGSPFYIAREWVPSHGVSGGTIQAPLGAGIAVADFRMAQGASFPVNGHHSMGSNPDRQVTLPSDSYTEAEFTVTLSADAQYRESYELRITSGGTPLPATAPAEIRLGAPPLLRLSPGQRQGMAVPGPKKAHSRAVRRSTTSGTSGTSASSAMSAFPAFFAASPPAASRPAAASRPPASALVTAPPEPDGIHGPYALASGRCGICHRAHTAQATNLVASSTQATLCFTCHDGTQASSNVKAQYALVRPANVNTATTREIYSHDTPPPGQHTTASLDEFGTLSNRHSECADCHNPHQATVTATRDSAQTETGWDASRRLAGVSGVAVVNGAAGATPTYTFLNGVNNLVTREYQLCFKCHSGSTLLPPPIAGKPSMDLLDKAAELNPANASFHPVEAQGKNQTAKMAASLAGTSPYKLWNFTTTSTIRCSSCHTSSETPGPPVTPVGDPTLPLPGSALAPHASKNRGILLRNYRDRDLKPAGEVYLAKDFALCLTCHAEEPFANSSGLPASSATNFRLHGFHLNRLAILGGGGTNIDQPGAGQGNAICAECHFRLHSTKNKLPQDVDGSRLVNFAPNVLPNGLTTPQWKFTVTGSGSCNLTSHGHQHDDSPYVTP